MYITYSRINRHIEKESEEEKMKEKDVLLCGHCGRSLSEEEAVSFDGIILCMDCYSTNTTLCDCCGDRIWSNDAREDTGITLCLHCYDYNYSSCSECGALISNEDAVYEEDSDEPYCEACYEKRKNNPIKSYNYKPEPIFYGSGNLFMGVELESDKGGEYDKHAKSILEVANRMNEHIYCKHDGSIEEGFEMVSHPMTYEYHLNSMNWKEIFDSAVEMGYRSHQTDTCGLHIHVNRSAFGKDYEAQEEVICRIVYFVENHWNELLKFSRRTVENINRWASRYGISTTAKDTYKNAKDRHCGRYVAVNLENYSTIEFRIFRGTLNYKTFIATLQLIDEICYHAINLTDGEMEGMSWSDFVSRILPKKAELIEYLKFKQLYVNETIRRGEDI